MFFLKAKFLQLGKCSHWNGESEKWFVILWRMMAGESLPQQMWRYRRLMSIGRPHFMYYKVPPCFLKILLPTDFSLRNTLDPCAYLVNGRIEKTNFCTISSHLVAAHNFWSPVWEDFGPVHSITHLAFGYFCTASTNHVNYHEMKWATPLHAGNAEWIKPHRRM